MFRVPAVPDAVPETRHAGREHLQRFGIESADAVELALAETLANAVIHAYPPTEAGELEVVVIVYDDAVEVVVRDGGVGFPNPEFQGAGYGVVLMEALADRFEFDTQPGGGTTVRMEFDRTSS